MLLLILAENNAFLYNYDTPTKAVAVSGVKSEISTASFNTTQQ
jgi:hypothetical protein